MQCLCCQCVDSLCHKDNQQRHSILLIDVCYVGVNELGITPYLRGHTNTYSSRFEFHHITFGNVSRHTDSENSVDGVTDV